MASSVRSVGFHSSLNTLNNTSIDSMHEIAIEEQSNSNSNCNPHSRPATLTMESPFGTPVVSESSVVCSATSPSAANHMKGSPMDAIKEWSVTTYKCTKQLVNEKLGKCQRTVDMELETEIERLRENQRKYALILKMSRDMTSQYLTIIRQQNAFYECLNELAMRESKTNTTMNDSSDGDNGDNASGVALNLGNDFRQNAEMMRSVAKNGEKLIMALNFFNSNLSTLVNKTIEDTIVTIRQYEMSRLEFDAEKNSTNNLLLSQQTGVNVTSEKLNNARCKYERLRDDVHVKMKFLDENKAKVMHKQLILFHNAFAAFASGNANALDSTLKQFSIKAVQSSWLEK